MTNEEQWNELCEQYDEAADALARALNAVIPKFGAVAQNLTNAENPTLNELDALDKAKEAHVRALDAMSAFMNKHR